MGAFESRVRVHAFNGDADASSTNNGQPDDPTHVAREAQEIPGIGKARVRAYHVNGSSTLFAPSGVFLGTPDTGTAVHELVHARVAELGTDLPLWFEEGLACFLGDGALYGGRWVVDGLACWPLRVLRDEQVDDAELAGLLRLRARDKYSPRDNLLVHFVGWAIVFDLAREAPHASWQEWLELFHRGASEHGERAEARLRVERTLADATLNEWLGRLSDPEPGVRLAAVRGTWKLHSQDVLVRLIDTLEGETDPEVRVALAINAVLAIGEIRAPGRTWRRVWREVVPILRDIELPDAVEQADVARFYQSLRGRGGSTDAALALLGRYWDE
jgi:hypothetical protein